MPSHVVPLLEGNPRALKEASRDELLQLWQHYRKMSAEMLRKAILENDRIDLLAGLVLNYQVMPLHVAIMKWQLAHPKSLQLVFRGAGKSTVGTVTKCIHLLLKDPNLRICIASKSLTNASGFLSEIKAHFEKNERLAEVFGPQFDPRRVNKWDSTEINILPRTRFTKESNITCVGVEGAVVSKHYDVVISDDLVDEGNSRTKHMRDKLKTWYYKTLDPCLLPPDKDIPLRGQHHMLGTRYHYDDLYGNLMAGELGSHTQIIPALNERGLSPWPEMYPPAYFEEKKRNSGIIIFNSQFNCDTEAMKGEVFEYDDCQEVSDGDIPGGLRVFMGSDLAVTEKQQNDQYANVVIGMDQADRIFVLDYFIDHIGFPKQKIKTMEFYDHWDPIRAGIESNAYQDVLRQELVAEDKERRFIPINTDQDKLTRAWKLAPLFEGKRVFFKKSMGPLIEQFVMFPHHRFKDGVDAFDLAYRASRRKRKRNRREYEPGVI